MKERKEELKKLAKSFEQKRVIEEIKEQEYIKEQEQKKAKIQGIKNVLRFFTGHLIFWFILFLFITFLCFKFNINETFGTWLIGIIFTILLITAFWSYS